jgi:hypothetical protein
MTKVANKIMWIGRATVFCVGLVVTLAIVLGAATTALAAAPGDPLKLGQVNGTNALTRLAGSTNQALLRIDNNSTGAFATALDLQVEPGKPPMRVNSTTEVQGLNADSLDGKNSSDFLGRFQTASNAAAVDNKSADEIGVNGRQAVSTESATNSDSSKFVTAECPAGKVVVGTGYDVLGAKSGTFPNLQTDIVVDELRAGFSSVSVQAYEETSTGASWSVTATAICAAAP